MVSGRDYDHMPEKDYLGGLKAKLIGDEHVQTFVLGSSNKIGAASADLRAGDDVVTVEHSSRRLTIGTTKPQEVVKRVKEIWRTELRGPSLRDRGAITA
jgi:hypothetical protein